MTGRRAGQIGYFPSTRTLANEISSNWPGALVQLTDGKNSRKGTHSINNPGENCSEECHEAAFDASCQTESALGHKVFNQ